MEPGDERRTTMASGDAPARLPEAAQRTGGLSGRAPRLLPWTTDDGKRCLLSTDNTGGYLSRLADEMEAIQVAMGSEVLEHAGKVLDDQKASARELRYAGVRLAECLRDALRVAESRGLRLPAPDRTDDDSDEGPTLLAGAMG